MDKMNQQFTRLGLDPYTKHPIIQKISEKTRISPQYIILAGIVLVFFNSFIPIFGGILTTMIIFLLPAYETYRTIESGDRSNDRRMLVFWTMFGLFYVFEEIFKLPLSLLPLYGALRFILLMAMYLPHINLAERMYDGFVRPSFDRYAPHFGDLHTPAQARQPTK